MDVLFVFITLAGILGLSLLTLWLDHKYQWQLSAWFNGTVANPFTAPTLPGSSSGKHDDKELQALKERVATLEKIVTDQSYELNQKINAL